MAKILGQHIPAELKNLAINGAMDFFQRIEGNTATINTATTTFTYSADMIESSSVGATVKNYSLARSTNVPTVAQSGFQSTYSHLFTMITGIGSFAAGDLLLPFQYNMEGLDFEKIHQKLITIGFWFNPSIAGTYSVCLRNNVVDRSYVTTFQASVGWQFVTISVQLDTVGTSWVFDNTLALHVEIGSIAGTTFQTSTLNTWQTGNFISASTATNWMATSGATIRVAQFSIVEGPLGFGATGFQRASRSIGGELALCQRYYEKSFPQGTAPTTASGTVFGCLRGRTFGTGTNYFWSQNPFCVRKRSSPIIATYNPLSANGTWRNVDSNTDVALGPQGTTSNGDQNIGLDCAAAVVNTSHLIHWSADSGL